MEYIYHNTIVASMISLWFFHPRIYWKCVWNQHYFCPASLQGKLVSEVQTCPTFKIFLRPEVPSYSKCPGFSGNGLIISAHILSSEPLKTPSLSSFCSRGRWMMPCVFILYLDIHLLY